MGVLISYIFAFIPMDAIGVTLLVKNAKNLWLIRYSSANREPPRDYISETFDSEIEGQSYSDEMTDYSNNERTIKDRDSSDQT